MTRETTAEESDLLRRLRVRERSALAEITNRYGKGLTRVAYLYLGDTHAAADVSQDTLLAAWDGAPRTGDSTQLRPWLYGILMNRCRKWQRAAWRRRLRELVVARQRPTVTAPLRASDSSVPDDKLEALRAALARLDAPQRVVLLLRYHEGLSVSETATALATSRRVRSRAARTSRSLVCGELYKEAPMQLNDFERQLRDDLHRLANAAPPAPTPGEVATRLARRGRRRTAATRATLGLLSVAALSGLWLSSRPSDPTPPETPEEVAIRQVATPAETGPSPKVTDVRSERPETTVPSPKLESISEVASADAVERSLSTYFAALEVTAAHLKKDTRAGLSFSLRGQPERSLETVREELTALLANYDEVVIALANGKIHYSFMNY